MANVKRTSMFLDRELVTQAASALGTKGVTETIHAAMRHVVAVEAGAKLADGNALGDIGVPSPAELPGWDGGEAGGSRRHDGVDRAAAGAPGGGGERAPAAAARNARGVRPGRPRAPGRGAQRARAEHPARRPGLAARLRRRTV